MNNFAVKLQKGEKNPSVTQRLCRKVFKNKNAQNLSFQVTAQLS